MSETNLVPVGADRSLTENVIMQMDSWARLSKALVASGMIPQKRPESALAVMLKAWELGVPLMQGFQSIYAWANRDGGATLTISAALMYGLAASRCGVRKRTIEWTDKLCKMEFSRPGWEPELAEYTWAEAQAAGLTTKDNWKKYPKDMLAARCTARGIRQIAPDYFANQYVVEEMTGDPIHESGDTGGGLDDLTARLEIAAVDVKPAPEPTTELFPESDQ